MSETGILLLAYLILVVIIFIGWSICNALFDSEKPLLNLILICLATIQLTDYIVDFLVFIAEKLL